MQEFPWRSSYPIGVPHEIEKLKYDSLSSMIEDLFKKYSDCIAYKNMGVQITYKKLDKLSDDFSSYLSNDLGLKKGDRIAIQLPNILQFPVVMFGAIKSGLIVVNTNPLYTPKEMLHQFNDAGAKAIVILSNFANKLGSIIKKTRIEHVIVTHLGDQLGTKGYLVNWVVRYVKKMVPKYYISQAVTYKYALKKGSQNAFQRVKTSLEDLLFLQYTGGTTGVSKGAMLTNANILSNIEQANSWLNTGQLKPRKELFITALPLYHIFALMVSPLFGTKIGACCVLITNPRDLKGFVKVLKKTPYSLITGVNTLFNGLINTRGFDKVDHSNLKIAVAGGMALQSNVAEKWEKITKLRIIEGYGLSETSPLVSVNPIGEGLRMGTIGLPVPSTYVIIIDEEGNQVPYDTPGELCVKGPQVMQGYWKNEKETKESFFGDYLKTGDIATISESGFLKLIDRKKEIVIVSGFNVYPLEVEECISAMDGVLEVGVIGVSDPKTGEAIKAIVVKKYEDIDGEKIKAHCKEFLAAYKRPKYISFVPDLPKSNVGKILRRVLKENDLKNNNYLN